jgi:hypothetical protein
VVELAEQFAAEAVHGAATVATDVLGGIAGLLHVMRFDTGLHLVHLSTQRLDFRHWQDPPEEAEGLRSQ